MLRLYLLLLLASATVICAALVRTSVRTNTNSNNGRIEKLPEGHGTNTQSDNGVVKHVGNDDLCKEIGDSDDTPCAKGPGTKPDDYGSNQQDGMNVGKAKGSDVADDGGVHGQGNADDHGEGEKHGDGNADDGNEDSGEMKGVDSGEDKYGNDIGEKNEGDDGKGGDDKGEDEKDDNEKDDDDDKDDGDKDIDGQGASDEGRYVNGVWVGARGSNGTTSDPACFPGAATVQLKCGCVVPMSELRAGMFVAVGGGRFSQVFGFTHRIGGKHQFVRLTTTEGSISASEGHYMKVDGEGYVAAGNVRIGNELRTGSGAAAEVIAISTVYAEGLYNPQTKHGDIVVDGLVASTYTTAVQPKVAHAALAPLRAAWVRLGLTTSFSNGKDIFVF